MQVSTVLGLIIVVFGGAYLLYLSSRVLLRARQTSELWALPVDKLSPHAWELLREALSDAEFEAVVKALNRYSHAQSLGVREPAPSVGDILYPEY